jgi:peptidoglycan hydrolase-like protein with peptidoglycan-binding domain
MQNKFITALTLIVFTFVTIFSPFPAPVKTVSAEEAVINTGSLRLVSNTAGFSFKMDLMPGDTDPAVKELQKVLNSSPDTAIAGTGSGSLGQESTYFGDSTKAAVIKFQEKYKTEILTPNGLTAGTGLVGKSTRTKLNLLLGVTTPTLASVGQPQSRASTAPVKTTESGVSTCKFIDLMAGINVVSAERANSARSTMGCTTVAPVIVPPIQTVQKSMTVCSFIDLLATTGIVSTNNINSARSMMNCSEAIIPSANIKINGSSSDLSLSSPDYVTVSWTSNNVNSCTGSYENMDFSGSQNAYVDKSQNFVISCSGPYGSVSDSITVKLSSTSNTDPLSISCFANPTDALIGDYVIWNAEVSGGTGDYEYVWSGTDNLSGTDSEISKNYQTEGVKNAQVTVTSGSEEKVSDCTATVSSDKTDIKAASVDLLINSEDNYYAYLDAKTTSQYVVSWSSENVSSCIGSSIPSTAGWNNTVKSTNGLELLNISTSTVFTLTCRDSSGKITADQSAIVMSDSGLTDEQLAALSGASSDSLSTSDINNIINDASDDLGLTVFGGTVSMVGICAGVKETTYKIGVEGTKPFTGWYVYYNKNKVAKTANSGASVKPKTTFITGSPILGSAQKSGGPSCDVTFNGPNTNPLISMFYFKNLGYIQEFGTSAKYGSNSN